MSDYVDWIEFQKTAGGLPPNLIGYLGMCLTKFITRGNLRDHRTIPGKHSTEGKYLSATDLPQREGPAPKTSAERWPVPQRQLDEPSQEIKTAIEELTERFAEENNLRRGKAFDSLDAYFLGETEVFHRHPKDYSHHVHVDPSDAKLLLVQGWGELFGLAGRVGQKLGTVLIFVPRNQEEIRILETIFKAAVDHAKKGKVE